MNSSFFPNSVLITVLCKVDSLDSEFTFNCLLLVTSLTGLVAWQRTATLANFGHPLWEGHQTLSR